MKFIDRHGKVVTLAFKSLILFKSTGTSAVSITPAKTWVSTL